jgi:hypothetical protein
MAYFDFTTVGPLEHLDMGNAKSPMVHHVLFLAPELEATPPFNARARLRFEGEIDEVSVSLAWQPKDGRHYAMLSPDIRKATRLSVGEEVTLRFRLVDDAEVDVPPDLGAALARSTRHRKLWEALTPGKQRGLVYTVTTAKTAPTRLKRIDALMAAPEDPGAGLRPVRKKKT